jgi:hypothetical protein
MRRSTVLVGLAAAVACFGAGLAAGHRFLAAPKAAPPLEIEQDAGGKTPKLIFDPDSITLLPDASLRLDLPPGFDAGAH